MIPDLPQDSALKNLSALVDEATMVTLVSVYLKRDDDIQIADCRPVYIRYKPGTSCLVRYDLTIMDASGTATNVTAHVKSFSDDRAARRWGSRKLDTLIRCDARQESDPPYGRVAYIPELNGLLQLLPVDYDLPFLVQAANSEIMGTVLRNVCPDGDDSVAGAPEVIRYKPGRKALLRYETSKGSVLYGKVHADDRSDRLATQTKALIDAGVVTPPVILSIPEHGFIAHAEFPGIQLASMRGTNDYISWMAPLADALHQLNTTEIPDAPIHTLGDEAARIRETIGILAIVAPPLRQRLVRIGEDIASRLVQAKEILTTNHGDFYDDQVIVSASGMSIIDLDEIRQAHPLLDIGNMLAHLRASAHCGEKIVAAREAFLARALALTAYNTEDVALFEAAGLIKLAPGPFRRLEEDWPQGIERILELAEQCIAGSVVSPTIGEEPPQNGDPLSGRPIQAGEDIQAAAPVDDEPYAITQIRDDALPQLSQLQDVPAMAARFSDLLAGSLKRVQVVRHKPGRRAILRYDMASDDQLYGKTFASERGPKVFEITRTITSAHAFGPTVALPDPVAFLPDIRLLIQRSVPGTSAEPALLDGDVSLAARIADALHAFHTSSLDLGRRHDLAKELSPLEMRVQQVGEHYPELRELAASCLAYVLGHTRDDLPWRHRPVHRDFYHGQLMIHEGELAVLDLDDAAMSEPAVDVANFASHLTLLGVQNPGSAPCLSQVRTAFVARYRVLDLNFDVSLFQFLTAATLLRLAGIHAPRTNGRSITCNLLLSSELALRKSRRHSRRLIR